MTRLHHTRKGAVQKGTLVSDMRDDGEKPTIRHRAQVATERRTRTMPPAPWLKRHAEELRKILGDHYDATLQAAEDPDRAVTLQIEGIQEKTWEEEVKKPASKKEKAAATSQPAAAAAA